MGSYSPLAGSVVPFVREAALVDLFPIDPIHHKIRKRPIFRSGPKGWRAYYHYQVLYSDPQLQWERRSWWRRLFSLRRY